MEPEAKRKLLRRTSEALDNAGLLLVEGLRDERALRSLGFATPILRANQSAERVAARAVALAQGDEMVLLFDFDEEGERKLRECRTALEALGARCDARSREHLKWLTGVRHIEDLPPAWRTLNEELDRGSRSIKPR